MKRIFNLYLFSILVGCILSSCMKFNKNRGESTYQDFGEDGMIPNKEYTFYPFENIETKYSNDTTSISISLRYTDICQLKSLPLKVVYASLKNDSIKEKLLYIPLFDDAGTFQGKGNLGVYESEVPFIGNQPFEEGYFISISTTEKETKGIISLGVICKKNYETYSR